ncbi:MAG TPA: lysyl oxidase family protein [Methylomirabilota bacterium]|nr:lysyl oxidase family protein [Methylomirabilota bacterium]
MSTLLTGLWILAFCATTTLLSAAPGSAQVVELRPNLQPFPAFDLRIGTSLSTGGKEIRFSTRSWNKGAGPLELVAGETGSQGQNVYQRVYRSDGTHQDYFAGTFVWHPFHNHFHFGDYALYSLDPINAPGGSSKVGAKTTFCVMDTNKVDGTLSGAPATAFYATCGTTVQGMSVGWADTYGYTLTGQSIDFTGNPSGDYCLTIQIDPKGRLFETDETDNFASSLLRIDAERSTITVLDASSCDLPGGGVIVAGISPASAKVGTSVPVTLTGSGFAAGMAVSFEGGSGPPPSAKHVVVSPDGTTIQATVTVKKGKPGKDPVWDVRVGSGILFGGFTVLP